MLFRSRGLMPGLAHLYLGEEAVAAGACVALREDDYIGSTHRGHGHLVARGADLDRMMAEILGKKTGYSKGKGGSMHIMAMDKGILGANGIVGGGIPMATGAGYSAKYRGTDQVTLCFFGDGAANEGTFHESINMAAAWDLPVVYVIENNLYGITVDSRRVTKEPPSPSGARRSSTASPPPSAAACPKTRCAGPSRPPDCPTISGASG